MTAFDAHYQRIKAQSDPETVVAFDALERQGEAPHYECSELGNARRLIAAHGTDLRYAPEWREWLHWDGRRWALDITGEAQRRGKQIAESILDQARIEAKQDLFKWGIRTQSASGIAHMLELASTEPGIPVLVDQLDADPWLFNTANGTVDLRTGELRAHDRRDLMTKLAPVKYQPDAECPTWKRFLSDVFADDDEVIGFVRRFSGYSLTGMVTEQKMVFCHGTGANGKSTLLNTLRAVTGDYGIQLDPQVLTLAAHDQHPTGLTDLRGARFVSTIETEQGRKLNESLVKQLTGGDPIRARRMHRDYFEFLPSHKLWFAGNHLPRIAGTDVGIWRRLALLPFSVSFAGSRADRDMGERLAAEAPGILAWCVRGCREWQEQGLDVPARIAAATTDYRNTQDHVGRFLADCCVVGDTFYVTVGLTG